MTPPDLGRLQKLLASSSVIAVFHGHAHYPSETRTGEIPVFGTGSVASRLSLHDGRKKIREIHPLQYRVATVDDDGSVAAPIHEVTLR